MTQSVANDTSYRGVCKSRNRWVAHVRADDRVFYLGSFGTEVQAARAWDAAVYWLREKLDMRESKPQGPLQISLPTSHKLNFPDETSDSNPPVINTRLREIMTELRVVIPEGAPTETPFVDFFHEVMANWFESNPNAEEWEGTATELHKLFHFAMAGLSVRQLGVLVHKLDGIKFRRSNGVSLITFDRAIITGVSAPQAKRLGRTEYRRLQLAFKRLYSNQTRENLDKVIVAFEAWRDDAAKTLSLPVMCCETKSVIAACSEPTCAESEHSGFSSDRGESYK